jgi:hypothetical protein
MRENSRRLRRAVATLLFGVACHGAAHAGSDGRAAFLYEQFSVIEAAALACQPPARDDKAGFGRNMAPARTAFVLALQEKGLSPEQAEAEAAKRSAEQKSRITSMIDKEGCDSAQMIPLLRQYFEISAWDPGKGPFPLAPPSPELSQAVKDDLLTAAGYKKAGGVWHNDCGRAIDPVFTPVRLAKKDVRQVIVTSADAVCYGHAERRDTVLQREGGKWTPLADLVGVLDVGTAVSHGYRELVLGGPGYCGNEIYRWTGRAYAYVCNQADDMDARQRDTCAAASRTIKWCRK